MAKWQGAVTARRVVYLDGHPPALRLFRLPLLRTMVERGHRVTACSPPADRSVIDSVMATGAEWRVVNLDRTGLNPLADLSTILSLTTLFHELRPDVVLLRTAKAVICGSFAGRRAGVARICSMIAGAGFAFGDGGIRRQLVGVVARGLFRHALAANALVLFQNPDDLALFADLGLLRDTRQGVVVSGSGVDLDRFQVAPLPEQMRFLMLARLIGDKGVREYAAAASRISSAYPSVRCHLAGSIDQAPGAVKEEEISQWIRDGSIDYLGQLDDVRQAIAASSVVVLPSYYREGVPHSLLEGLAMGRPLITTNTPGCRETVRHDANGLLIAPRDPEALASAMALLVENSERLPAMGAESRRLAEARFDVNKVNSEVLNALAL